MTLESFTKYEFGDFALYPREKVLLHFNKPLSMPGKEFEILSFLVVHANSFVSKQEIVESVWGADVEVADSNMSHIMSKVRKAIGCDARKPRFIRTVYNKNGYRFIAPVRKDETSGDRVQSISEVRGSNKTYELTSHLIVPVFLGDSAYEKLNLPEARNDWGEYKVRETESGRLCLGLSGFGVWHLTERHLIRDISQIATWRKQIYDEILNRKHSVRSRTNEILRSIGSDRLSIPELGKFGYVFSMVQLEGTSQRRKEATRNLLKVLASLSLLEGSRTEKGEIEKREIDLLSGEIELRDLKEFGQAGFDLGFAGWDGVSYFHSGFKDNSISEKIVEFEIVLQSLWWACKCVIEMRQANDSKLSGTLKILMAGIKRSYAQIRTIHARESPSQRSMVEAILGTSRIKQMVEAAVE